MAADGSPGLRQLVVLALSFGCLSPHCSVAAFPPGPCREGFVQHDPIALGCQGGNRGIKFELTQAGTPHQVLLWQAPTGTKDLVVTAKLSTPVGGSGRAALKVACSGSGKVLIGEQGEHLNRNRLHGKIHGGHWQWSGNQESGFGESVEEWFRVNGTLPCDVEVSFTNEAASRLIGYLQYEWAGIAPCPAFPLGCKPCSDEEATCSDHGNVPVCDGSPFVKCMTPAAAAKAKEEVHRPGCCFSYYANAQGKAVVKPSTAVTKGDCAAKADLDRRGYVGWNLRCPKDAAEADTWRQEDGAPPLVTVPPHAPPTAPTTTTLAGALPTTSLLMPMTNALAGAFALEVQSKMAVDSKSFQHLLLVAIAECLGIQPEAFKRFKVVALGKKSENKAAASVKVAEASTGAVIIGVGYEVYAGSAARETEIQTRLNNMGGPASTARASLADIMARNGVRVLAVQVTYPPATVSQGMLATLAPPVLPGGTASPSLPIAAPAALSTRQQPAAISSIGIVGLGLVIIVCCCLWCGCCRVLTRTKAPDTDDRLSRAEAGIDRSASARASQAARNSDSHYPAGYEPVNRSEDSLSGGSIASVERTPSMASDSSEASGLRLLGNDGM